MSKTILITGAAKRVGRALALHFAAQGWHVAAHYGASQDDAQSLKNMAKGTMSLFQEDFTTANAAQRLFDAVCKTCGTPDVLINNAARFERDDGGMTEQSFAAHMAVNATTPIMLAGFMRGGIVFNMLDRTLDWSWPLLPAYVLSKTVLEEWTQRSAPTLDKFIFGLRLGPTLRNPRESEAHFSNAISAYNETQIEDIVKVMDKVIAAPDGQPRIVDL